MTVIKRRVLSLLGVVLVAGGARGWAQPAPDNQVELALRKLDELGSVLMIAAHPDDERTNVLVYFARGRHMRTAYLSLTRGEGGQNLIGSEQGAALGLIRTQELLMARRIDGAEQFFSRAIDFGFTKTETETMEKWGREDTLSDVVWVIRRYRPDVIMLGFSGTPADGHGQHQESAILGKEAYEAAGDATRFPEQLKYVQPWHASKLVSAGGFGRGGAGRGGPPPPPPVPPVAPVASVDTSGYSTFLGYSFDQLATISRSQHRSQGMANTGAAFGGRGGGPPAPEPAPPSPDLFVGIDHSWNRLPGGARVGTILDRAVREFDPEHPEKTLPLLAEARPLMAAISDPLAKIKLVELDELVADCAGLWAEAQAREAEVTQGSKVAVVMNIYPRLKVDVKVESAQPEGLWDGPVLKTFKPRPGGGVTANVDLEIPATQPYSQPYWLQKPPVGEHYTVSDPLLTGLPMGPVEQMRFRLTVAGIPVEITRPIENRSIDRAESERDRTVTVVPPVSVNTRTGVAMFPSAAARKVGLSVRANVPKVEGVLRLDLPAGWKAQPASQPFRMEAADEERELSFEVTPPAREGTGELRAIAVVGGREIEVGMQTINYPHIPVEVLFPPSDVKLVRSDIQVTAKHVGYIMGAGDEVPEALRQLGIEVTQLNEDELAKGNLGRFDAIVAGVRAYNVRADLRANQARLMDYVKNGGTYVVQYMSAGAANIGPYPITIPAGNAYRVTVEEAPVAFTHPDSRLLEYPNHITARDFEGWVQERGLLFSTEWDPHYETVLKAGDPGEKPLEGGELWTHYGKGVYIFSAWVWFRELPAGVPGAYRLFANMLSAK